MAKTRSEQVQAAIKSIREFYSIGLSIPRKRKHKETYRDYVIQAAAQRLQMNPDTVLKARLFADPAAGYTRQELKELCDLIRDEQTKMEPGKSVFSRSHLIRLLSVRRKDGRKNLQEEAIRGGWSKAELEAAIAERYGRRKQGGRRRRVPEEREPLLSQLEKMGESWRRWYKQVCDETTSERDTLLHKALRDIKARVKMVTKGVLGLQETVAKKLGHPLNEEGSKARRAERSSAATKKASTGKRKAHG